MEMPYLRKRQNDQALDGSFDSQVGCCEGAVNSSFSFLPDKAVLTGLEG